MLKVTARFGVWVLVGFAVGTVAWRATALAQSPLEDRCTTARVQAWAKYVQCMEKVVGGSAGIGIPATPWPRQFWNCRHKYFKNWTKFQTNGSLQGSTCDSVNRFVNIGDGTETDRLTGLMWERKDIGNVDTQYTWATSAEPVVESGPAFIDFLAGVQGLGGSYGWRMATFIELQTILADFPCTGDGGGATCVCTAPCLGSGFSEDVATMMYYWTSTTYQFDVTRAWVVGFADGGLGTFPKYSAFPPTALAVRAVRGGL